MCRDTDGDFRTFTARSGLLTWRLHGSLPQHRPFREWALPSGQAFAALDRLLDEARTGPLLPSPASGCRPSSDTPAVPLPKLTKSLKGITANKANVILGLTGRPFWQEES